jgi:hypothetical protein
VRAPANFEAPAIFTDKVVIDDRLSVTRDTVLGPLSVTGFAVFSDNVQMAAGFNACGSSYVECLVVEEMLHAQRQARFDAGLGVRGSGAVAGSGWDVSVVEPPPPGLNKGGPAAGARAAPSPLPGEDGQPPPAGAGDADLVFSSTTSGARVEFTNSFEEPPSPFLECAPAGGGVLDDDDSFGGGGGGGHAGKIVVATGAYAGPGAQAPTGDPESVDSAVPVVDLSTVEMDPRCVGVVSASDNVSETASERCYRFANLRVVQKLDPSSGGAAGLPRVRVNRSGTGSVLVCGQNGDIGNGDLICTSGTPGCGMRQPDDIVRAHTVAKATQACTFGGGDYSGSNEDSLVQKLVGCIFML